MSGTTNTEPGLQTAMATHMFSDAKARARFEKACKRPDDKLLAAWSKHYGWQPPKELAEWTGVQPAYHKMFEAVSDVWMLRGVDAGSDIAKLVNTSEGLLALTTGLCHFGDDPSGDTCWLSTLPHPKGLAEIYVLDHEDGSLGARPHASIASFVAAAWGDVDTKRAAGSAKALFDRMQWMWSFAGGEPGYHLAEAMAKAPHFDTWLAEKAELAKSPWLANYWMLAHYFLGNTAACAEAVKLASKCPGQLTPALAKLVGQLIEQPKAKLGKLSAAALADLRAAVAKNADEKLLEPGKRDAVAKERAGDIVKADPKAIKQRLAAGEDGWALIAAFPDDTATHDLVLAELAKKDERLAKLVKTYHAQRKETDTSDHYSLDLDHKLDGRLSPALGAAFRAGLAFDADHPRAASSLVHALAHLDDDVAMTAFAAAIETCKMDDDRIEYIVKGLRDSKHPRAKDILARAAWRFFDFFDATKQSLKKTAKQGPTLDNMFRTHSHLLTALVTRIRLHDDEAEKLADKVLSVHEDMRVLGVAYAAAFRLAGERKLERHARLAEVYCKSLFDMPGERLAEETLYNLAEAALAHAILSPAVAEPALRAVLDRDDPRIMKLDKIACALAGLLHLAPADPALLAWAERILGNRTGATRVYGVLRGVAAGRVTAAKPWVPWHVYYGCSSNHIGEKPAIMRAARQALVALGDAEPPPFDETDEFANQRSDADLPRALFEHGKHLLDWTFQRIVERKLVNIDVVHAAAEILRDHYRYSADDDTRSNDRHRVAGLQCLLAQGQAALPDLASLLALPDMAGDDKTVVVYVMALVEPIPDMLARLSRATEPELVAALTPTPAAIGSLDFAAAMAFSNPELHAAIEHAIRWRFSLVDADAEADHWLEDEPIANGLARIAAQLGSAKSLLAELRKGENYHLHALIDLAKSAKPTELAFAGDTATFIQATQGDNGTKCTITLTRPDKIDVRVEDCYVQGILKESAFTQSGTYEAIDLDRIARALGVLGYADATPKPKSAKSKSKKR
jgi:hypothetical protein